MSSKFFSIEDIHYFLDEISKDIPKEFFKELNGGIILLDELKYHPKSIDNSPLFIMGDYSFQNNIRQIRIYYGSLEKVYRWASRGEIYKILWDLLIHEFTHHLESLAGEKDLEIEDNININKYLQERGH